MVIQETVDVIKCADQFITRHQLKATKKAKAYIDTEFLKEYSQHIKMDDVVPYDATIKLVACRMILKCSAEVNFHVFCQSCRVCFYSFLLE